MRSKAPSKILEIIGTAISSFRVVFAVMGVIIGLLTGAPWLWIGSVVLLALFIALTIWFRWRAWRHLR